MAQQFENWFEPQPSLILGEDALGRQRNSTRPTSAGFSFGRQERKTIGKTAGLNNTPGPTDYDTCAAQVAGVPSAVFGSTPQINHNKPYQYPNLVEQPISYEHVERARSKAIFGTATRNPDAIFDTDLMRACPEARFGKEGPGLVYNPNYKKVSTKFKRPSSAPSYTMPCSKRAIAAQDEDLTRTRPEVAPSSYKSQGSIGVHQTDSRRRNSRSCSFSRATRFPPLVPASADSPDGRRPPAQCGTNSTIGGAEIGKHKMRRPPCATFGSASREESFRTRAFRSAADKPISKSLGYVSLPHPSVAPVRDRVKYSGIAR